MKDRIPGIVLSLGGIILILLVFFPKESGLDPENLLGLQDWWGNRHYLILIIGTVLLPSCFYITYQRIRVPLSPIFHWIQKKFSLDKYLYRFLDIGSIDNTGHSLSLMPLLLWISLLLPVFLLTLHCSGILVFGWKSIELANMRQLADGRYIFQVQDLDPEVRIFEWSQVNVFENDTNHVGNFSIFKTIKSNNYLFPDLYIIKDVYISMVDMPDPASIGNRYTLRYPATPSIFVVKLLILLAYASSLVFIIRYRFSLKKFMESPPLYVAVILWTAAFILNRLWLIVDFPIAGIHPDSNSYFIVSQSIGAGTWPHFHIRSFGYPVLLKLVFTASNRVMSLVIVQNFFSYLAGLTFVIASYYWKRILGVLAAIAMIAFYSGVTPIESDSAMLSESLYTSFIVLSFGFLLYSFSKYGNIFSFACGSFFIAASLLTRPGGIFLVVSFLMVTLYMLWNQYSRMVIAAHLAPFLLMVLSMCLYNYASVRVFSVTAWGEANLAVATFTFWEKDESYPADINSSIDKIKGVINDRFNVVGIDPSRMNDTWDHDYLCSVFVQGFNGKARDMSMSISGNYYDTNSRQWIRKISLDSIKKHPDIYFKFVVTMLRNYYTMPNEVHFSSYIYNRIKLIYLDNQFSAKRGIDLMVKMGKEFADSPPPKTVIINSNINDNKSFTDKIILIDTPLSLIYNATYYIKLHLFTTQLWVVGFIGVMLVSLFKLVNSKFKDNTAFVLFLMTISNVGASVIVSLVEYSQPRYSYPMEWTYYFSVLVGVPLLFISKVKNVTLRK
jgi:hypothetical protein